MTLDLDSDLMELTADTEPAAHPPRVRTTGTRCSICNRKQFHTPAGATCAAGHGGADPVDEYATGRGVEPKAKAGSSESVFTEERKGLAPEGGEEPGDATVSVSAQAADSAPRARTVGRISAKILNVISGLEGVTVHELILGTQDAIVQYVCLRLEESGVITRSK